MAGEINHIRLLPETPGWRIILSVTDDNGTPRWHEFGVGDVIQFYEEVERTLGKWLADGPADFHNAEPDPLERHGVRIIDGQEFYSAAWLEGEDNDARP